MNPADIINEEEIEESVGDMTARQSKLALINTQIKETSEDQVNLNIETNKADTDKEIKNIDDVRENKKETEAKGVAESADSTTRKPKPPLIKKPDPKGELKKMDVDAKECPVRPSRMCSMGQRAASAKRPARESACAGEGSLRSASGGRSRTGPSRTVGCALSPRLAGRLQPGCEGGVPDADAHARLQACQQLYR